jgi:DNA invertase Pin-like site-specific DNA recombinase
VNIWTTSVRAKNAKTPVDGHLIGYARVSTTGQGTATQEVELKRAGCDIIRTEKVSGGSQEGRSELASILEFIRLGGRPRRSQARPAGQEHARRP